MQKAHNYAAWQVKIEDFPENGSLQDQLFFLLRFGILAPSSHNSQPWKFRINNDQIEIYSDSARKLPVADKSGRLVSIGIGCAVENILIAADYYGFSATVDYLPAEEANTNSLLGKITFSPKGPTKDDPSHLAHCIAKRYSNRHPYRNNQLPKKFLEWVKSISSAQINIDIITEQSVKNALANVVLDARETEFDNAEFRKELAHWKRTNITQAPDGMPGFTLGFPLVKSLVAPTLIKYKNVAKLTRKQEEKVLKERTPYMVVISTPEDNNLLQYKVGQIFEKIALQATKEGVAINIMASAICYGEFYKEIQKILGISARPQLFFRMGYAEKPMLHSPRLSINDVIKV